MEKRSGDDDQFFFRPYTSSNTNFTDTNTDEDEEVAVNSDGCRGLLVVHQAGWWRCLLERYDSMCLLDATYNTTRYAVPLFFLCVCMNVDYVVIVTFITLYEDTACIAEALDVVCQ